jgi:hypothetical protein
VRIPDEFYTQQVSSSSNEVDSSLSYKNINGGNNMHFVDKLLPQSPRRENFSEVNRMMSGDFVLPSSLRKKNIVSNR